MGALPPGPRLKGSVRRYDPRLRVMRPKIWNIIFYLIPIIFFPAIGGQGAEPPSQPYVS